MHVLNWIGMHSVYVNVCVFVCACVTEVLTMAIVMVTSMSPFIRQRKRKSIKICAQYDRPHGRRYIFFFAYYLFILYILLLSWYNFILNFVRTRAKFSYRAYSIYILFFFHKYVDDDDNDDKNEKKMFYNIFTRKVVVKKFSFRFREHRIAVARQVDARQNEERKKQQQHF